MYRPNKSADGTIFVQPQDAYSIIALVSQTNFNSVDTNPAQIAPVCTPNSTGSTEPDTVRTRRYYHTGATVVQLATKKKVSFGCHMPLSNLDRYPNQHLSVSGSGYAEFSGERGVAGFGITYLSEVQQVSNTGSWNSLINVSSRYQFLPSRMATFGNGCKFDLPATPIVSFSSDQANDNIVLFAYFANQSGDENALQLQSAEVSLQIYRYTRDLETFDPSR